VAGQLIAVLNLFLPVNSLMAAAATCLSTTDPAYALLSTSITLLFSPKSIFKLIGRCGSKYRQNVKFNNMVSIGYHRNEQNSLKLIKEKNRKCK